MPTQPSPQSQYIASFADSACTTPARIEKALAFAHDARKFEIELYWKRAAYFWTFTAAAFAGYIAVLSAEKAESRPQALLLVSCLGLVFSVAWYFVNRASKYWQTSWELHVDLLENELMGPIYKTVIHHDPSFFSVAAAYPFSVSKLNQLLSFFVACMFAVMLADTLWRYFELTWHWQLFPSACLLATAGCLVLFWKLGRVGRLSSKAIATIRATELTSYSAE